MRLSDSRILKKKHSEYCFVVAILLGVGQQPVQAQYTLYDDDYALLSAGLQIQTASLGAVNNRGGDAMLHTPYYPVDKAPRLSDIYAEMTIEPNIKAALKLPKDSQLYGGFSMIYSAMLGHDPSLFTYRNEFYRATLTAAQKRQDLVPYPYYKDWFMSEERYIGWRSGKLFEALGENAIDLSAGDQDYKLGTGLLLGNGTDDGGYRGSYWIGSRTVFVNTLIARLNIGNWKFEGFHLENRPRQSGNLKRYNGMNVEYNYQDRARFGFSYINDDDYTGDVQAETNVYDFRVSFVPLPETLPNLSINSEYVHQLNNKYRDDNPLFGYPINYYQYGDVGKKTVLGGYAEIEYKFNDLPWKPTLSYRYASLGYGFDYMNFGYTTWGTWYQGEIFGEFLTDATNLKSHVGRLIVKPTDKLTLNLIYYHFTFDNPKGMYTDWNYNPVTAKKFGNELDFIAEWALTDSIDLAAGIEMLIPSKGASQVFNSQVFYGSGTSYGGDRVWVQGMVYASFKF